MAFIVGAQPNLRPLLRADALVSHSNGCLELDLGGDVYNINTSNVSALEDTLIRMNGCLDLDEICRQSGLLSSTAEKVVDLLVDAGAVHFVDESTSGVIDTKTFTSTCRSLYAHWKERLFGHQLWLGLADGSLPRSVFIGWSIESYWFILGVLDRLPMAIAHSRDNQIKEVFRHHFAEEWDHFIFFERSLDILGVTANQRAEGEPLPTTRAVQNWMRTAARQDPLCYAVCSGFLESTGRDRSTARAFFDHLGANYGDEGIRAVAPMADHVSLDEAYGHGGFVEKIIAHESTLDVKRARAALSSAFGLVETLEMWSTDILRHYVDMNALPLGATRCYRRVKQ
jgi:pyrroloquinoline quinone (PQQ) biosynthesis protein C